MLNDKKIMSFTKPVSALADRPRLSPNDLKAWFDSNSTKECKEAINAIIDSLVATSGSSEIGASIEGIAEQTVFGVLTVLKTLIDDRYTIAQTDSRLDMKFDKTTAQDLVKTIAIDTMTGLFTVTKYDGTIQKWDTALEKVALDARLDGTEFVLTLADGTEQRVELSAFIDTYNFLSTATISATTTGSGNNKNLEFAIRDGSITRSMMDRELLEEIIGYVESASASAARASKSEQSALTSKNDAGVSASNAFTSETNAKQSELNAKLYEDNAHVSDTNALVSATNSEASAVRSEKAAIKAEEIAGKDYLTPSMVVNNLIAGGISVPLSAEMGKQLNTNKVDKVAGKSLSTNDYTTVEKQKLAGLFNYDDTAVKHDITEANSAIGSLQRDVVGVNGEVNKLKLLPKFESIVLSSASWSSATPSTYTLLDPRYSSLASYWEFTIPDNVTESQVDAFESAEIDIDGSVDGVIKFIAFGTKPTIDLPVLVKIEK